MMRIVVACLLAVLPPLSAQAPAWTVAATPMTAVGTAAGDPNLELAGVLGARRLADGRLVIANAAPLELRLYDAKGAFLARIGRKGSGPGEYRGRMSVYGGPGDSLLVYDDGTSRWTLYTPQATLVRSWVATSAERNAFDPVQYRQTLVHSNGRPLTACYRPMIAALPMPRDTAYRDVFPDGSDRAWVRDEGSATWLVRSLTGRVLGRVTLPIGFEVLQIGNGFVAGMRRNHDGIEQVEVLAVSMPMHEPAPACAARLDAIPRDTARITRTLDIDLRNLESAGAAYRSDYGHYALTIDSVQRASHFTLSTGTQLSLGARGGAGWDAVARNPNSPGFCRILIGEIAPIWLHRIAFCGH